MTCSKPLPPFTYELLCFLNRDQLERFSVVCRPMKNFIDRYFHSKPHRVFDLLVIRGGSYALIHKGVQWHLNREDYNVHQFLAGQKCNVDESKVPSNATYYSFAEMHPYLGPTVRINSTTIVIDEDSTYNTELIEEMESIAYLWRDGNIFIRKPRIGGSRIVAEDIQLILNSPTILLCQELRMVNAHFSLKDYKVFSTMKVIILNYDGDDDTDYNYWADFLEQPGVKPIVTLRYLNIRHISRIIVKALGRLKDAFSSAVLPNAFKVVFLQDDVSLTEFRETNKTSGAKLELKKGLPVEWQEEYLKKYHSYTLERTTI